MSNLTEGVIDWSTYPTVFNPDTLHRKGLCPVTTLAHKEANADSSISAVLPESHSLYFEVHGDGPQKVVLVMGLNASCFGWSVLVDHLTKVKEQDGSYRYSVVVFDNRGVGNSGTPRGPYSTSGMAQDVIILTDYIGWTSPRQLHVVGISMGGMIALELASRIAPRIISLSLIVTTSGGFGMSTMTPWVGLSGLIRLTFTPDPNDKIKILMPMLYPQKFLDSPASQWSRPDITNYQYLAPETLARISITRKQTLVGALSQFWAARFHRVSAARLREIAKTVPKVYIMTGDEDNLIKPENSHILHQYMPEAQFEVWEGTGHAILGQHAKRYPAAQEKIFDEANERLKASTP